LLRSEKDLSGNFIGTQDLKEALGFMRSKTKSIPKKSVNELNSQTEMIIKEKTNLPKLKINPVVAPTLKDPFSPRNANMHTSLSSNIGNSTKGITTGSTKKFDFPGKIFCE
jgi:hypothetical protein